METTFRVTAATCRALGCPVCESGSRTRNLTGPWIDPAFQKGSSGFPLIGNSRRRERGFITSDRPPGIIASWRFLLVDELPEYFCDLPEWARRAVVGHLTREFPDASPGQIEKALGQAATLTGPVCNLAAWLASAMILLREATAGSS